jgi:hypothetical protein
MMKPESQKARKAFRHERRVVRAEYAVHQGVLARARADAWARSPEGTPYGATTPTPATSSKVPEVLDEKALGRVRGKS